MTGPGNAIITTTLATYRPIRFTSKCIATALRRLARFHRSRGKAAAMHGAASFGKVRLKATDRVDFGWGHPRMAWIYPVDRVIARDGHRRDGVPAIARPAQPDIANRSWW